MMFWDFGQPKSCCIPNKAFCISKKSFCIPKKVFCIPKKVFCIPNKVCVSQFFLYPLKSFLYQKKKSTTFAERCIPKKGEWRSWGRAVLGRAVLGVLLREGSPVGLRWVSGGSPVGLRWVSGGSPVGLRGVSGGSPGVRGVSGGLRPSPSLPFSFSLKKEKTLWFKGGLNQTSFGLKGGLNQTSFGFKGV